MGKGDYHMWCVSKEGQSIDALYNTVLVYGGRVLPLLSPTRSQIAERDSWYEIGICP